MAKTTATNVKDPDQPDTDTPPVTTEPGPAPDPNDPNQVPADETTAAKTKALADEELEHKIEADKSLVPDGSDALGPVTDAEAVALAYDGHPDPNQAPHVEPIGSAPADAREDPLSVARRVIQSALNVNVAKIIHDQDTTLRQAISGQVDGMSVHDVRIRTQRADDGTLLDIQVQLFRGEWQSIATAETEPELITETGSPTDDV